MPTSSNGKSRAELDSSSPKTSAQQAHAPKPARSPADSPDSGGPPATASAALLAYLRLSGCCSAETAAQTGMHSVLAAADEAQLSVLHLAAGNLTDDGLLRLMRALFADQLLSARAAGDSAALLKLLDKGALLFGRLRTAPRAAPAAESAVEPQLELGVDEACAEVQQLLAALAAERELDPAQLAELALPLSLLHQPDNQPAAAAPAGNGCAR